MPLVEIKDFNALINNKSFFDQPVKNKDFSYHQNYYKLMCIDLSRETNTNIPQQINFIGA